MDTTQQSGLKAKKKQLDDQLDASTQAVVKLIAALSAGGRHLERVVGRLKRTDRPSEAIGVLRGLNELTNQLVQAVPREGQAIEHYVSAKRELFRQR